MQKQMSKSVTKPNKLHKGELAYLNVFTLRFLGKTFEEIGEATGYSPAYLRQLFMKGGKLHDPWKEFELKAREVSIDETYTVLFAELPNVVRAMIQNSKLPFDMSLYRDWETDRKSTRLNSSHSGESRMPSSA